MLDTGPVWRNVISSDEHPVLDLRYCSQMLMKAPGFSFLASIKLALAIGANLPAARAARVDVMQALRSE